MEAVVRSVASRAWRITRSARIAYLPTVAGTQAFYRRPPSYPPLSGYVRLPNALGWYTAFCHSSNSGASYPEKASERDGVSRQTMSSQRGRNWSVGHETAVCLCAEKIKGAGLSSSAPTPAERRSCLPMVQRAVLPPITITSYSQTNTAGDHNDRLL